MSSTPEDSPRTASIVRTLCAAEGCDVVLRFDGPISAPTTKYNGRSYQTETVPKATLHATIQRASVEDMGQTLLCFAGVEIAELDRVDIDPSVVYTEPVDGQPQRCMIDIRASRQWWDEPDIPREDVEQAIEDGREEDVLPPWQGPPTVTVDVERTEDCLKRSYESDFHLQYSAPTHEMGTLRDVRIK